jgi:hypothetical protein
MTIMYFFKKQIGQPTKLTPFVVRQVTREKWVGSVTLESESPEVQGGFKQLVKLVGVVVVVGGGGDQGPEPRPGCTAAIRLIVHPVF